MHFSFTLNEPVCRCVTQIMKHNWVTSMKKGILMSHTNTPQQRSVVFIQRTRERGRKRWKKHMLMRWRSEVELRMSPEAYQDWPVAKTVRSPPQAQETPSKVNWGRKIGEVHASTAAKNRSDAPRNTNPEHSGKDFRLVEKIRAGN